MELARNMREKIKKLEKEKTGLLVKIEALSEKGEVKARELEDEVAMLGKEVQALERLLNVKEKTRTKKT